MKILKSFFIIFVVFFPTLLFAIVPDSTQPTDIAITQLLNSVKNLPPAQRLDTISFSLLNKPYQKEPLGEGNAGVYNQEPLYRLDQFDCETYVNTVLALALADDLNKFQTNIRKINYLNGDVAFTNRCHFTDAEWVPNNIKNGFIKEITQEVAGSDNIALEKTYLNRQNWYAHLPIDRIKIPGLSPSQQAMKLQQLRAEGIKVQNTEAKIIYVPLSKLLSNNKPDLAIFNKIPNGTIILFVRNDPHQIEKIGTDVNISHMGFVIWKNQKPYLRAASSLKKKTMDLPLIGYLRYYLNKPNMKGIALFQTTL